MTDRGSVGARRVPHWLSRLGKGQWAFIAVTLMMVVAVLSFYGYYRSVFGDLEQENVVPALGPNRPPETGALNVLLVGSDSRAGENKKYGATSTALGERSDTIMLLHLSPDRDRATMISFPRDSMVAVPHCNRPGGGSVPAGLKQINSAFNDGGIVCAIRTIESLTHIRINHFMKVDFTGFKGIIDAIGGIPICLPKAVDDPKAKFVLPAGKHIVNGEQALGYVRTRYTLGDGSDLSRIKRQQVFLTQVMEKITDGGLLTNPVALNSFLHAAVASVTVDTELTVPRMLEVARSVQGMTSKELKGITVPVEAYPADPNRVQFAEPAASEFFNRIRSDVEVSAPPAATVSAKPEIANDQVRVQVLNASGKVGLAGQVAAELADQGFVVTHTGNAAPAPVTAIHYATKDTEGAAYGEAIASRLSKDKREPVAGKVKPASLEKYTAAAGGAKPAAPATGPTVQLIIGADWPGVRVVSTIPDSLKDKVVDGATNPCM
ncbi:LCP family protein [Nonomuraea sp. NBC_01738]|uniref:LCP family protein n=1 Tax=Nonomuraea sp. NBC_01738 TaxID=2976003 RepID=UPI002E14B6AA|nr:LCP family protein [Nonomuraea sp. NBC_01738]